MEEQKYCIEPLFMRELLLSHHNFLRFILNGAPRALVKHTKRRNKK
jgi:hypothetical protein